MLGLGNAKAPVFILSMIAGIVAARTLRTRTLYLAKA